MLIPGGNDHIGTDVDFLHCVGYGKNGYTRLFQLGNISRKQRKMQIGIEIQIVIGFVRIQQVREYNR